MSSSTIEHVRDVMPTGAGLHVEVRAGAAFEVLIALSASVEDEGSGELWLHLLGLALELPASTDAGGFVDAVAATEPAELRRHLVGVHVPAWREVAGAETLERAAAGEAAAASELLSNERYYAGKARDALGALLPQSAAQTKRHVVAVLRRFVGDVFAEQESATVALLEEDARAQRRIGGARGGEAMIGAATGGYVYEPEPEFARVVLIPHLAAAPWLLLCQHRDARLICYPVERPATDAAEALADRALRLGRALADERRIRILRRLVAGEASLGELAETVGLAKSTAHHHLSQLRAAGLVTLRGNARGYWYTLRAEGLGEARSLLGELLAAP
jgi:DNA-binding transcriptional ArsR family regulator